MNNELDQLEKRVKRTVLIVQACLLVGVFGGATIFVAKSIHQHHEQATKINRRSFQ